MTEVWLAESSSSVGISGSTIVLVIMYFVPTLVAFSRHVRNAGSVAVINVFLGWTVIGWIIALAMAVRTADQSSSPSAAREDVDSGRL